MNSVKNIKYNTDRMIFDNKKCSQIKAVVLDLDGTVYCGNDLIDGALETIEYLRDIGKKIIFCTNNSTLTHTHLIDKLHRIGIDCHQEDIYSSGTALIRYVNESRVSDMWFVGSDEIRGELEGITHIVKNPEDASVLVVGMDFDYTYDTITNAVRAAFASNKMVFCGEDPIFIGEGGKIYPGCASITSAIRACTKKQPDIIIGKPHQYMMDIIKKDNGLKPEEILVVGDNYDLDVMFALNNGASAIQVSQNNNNSNTVVRIHDLMHFF